MKVKEKKELQVGQVSKATKKRLDKRMSREFKEEHWKRLKEIVKKGWVKNDVDFYHYVKVMLREIRAWEKFQRQEREEKEFWEYIRKWAQEIEDKKNKS